VMLNLPVAASSPRWRRIPACGSMAELSSLTHGVLLNTRESPVSQRPARAARPSNLAVDRQGHHQESLRGARSALEHGDGPQCHEHFRPPARTPMTRGAAKALLAEAGYGNGFDLQLWQSMGRWTLAEEMAQVIAGYWEQGWASGPRSSSWNGRSTTSGRPDRSFPGRLLLRVHQRDLGRPPTTVQRFKPDFGDLPLPSTPRAISSRLFRDYEQTFDPKPTARAWAAAGPEGVARGRRCGSSLWPASSSLTGMSKKVQGIPDPSRRLHSGPATPTWRPEALPFLLRPSRSGWHRGFRGCRCSCSRSCTSRAIPVLLMVSSDAPPDVVDTTRRGPRASTGRSNQQLAQYLVSRRPGRPRRLPAAASAPVATLIAERLACRPWS